MDIKSRKNAETERAISSLKTVIKMAMAAVAALGTYFADCHLIAIIIAAFALLYTALMVFSQKAIAILVQYYQRGTHCPTQPIDSIRFIVFLMKLWIRREKYPSKNS
jgi:hypothetical protein